MSASARILREQVDRECMLYDVVCGRVADDRHPSNPKEKGYFIPQPRQEDDT
jgi:hypothetical protein